MRFCISILYFVNAVQQDPYPCTDFFDCASSLVENPNACEDQCGFKIACPVSCSCKKCDPNGCAGKILCTSTLFILVPLKVQKGNLKS